MWSILLKTTLFMTPYTADFRAEREDYPLYSPRVEEKVSER